MRNLETCEIHGKEATGCEKASTQNACDYPEAADLQCDWDDDNKCCQDAEEGGPFDGFGFTTNMDDLTPRHILEVAGGIVFAMLLNAFIFAAVEKLQGVFDKATRLLKGGTRISGTVLGSEHSRTTSGDGGHRDRYFVTYEFPAGMNKVYTVTNQELHW
tara:strand:- start:229 stop:705 length:477 start_codon:yes stop_codon:yes gene_type:complete